MRLALPLFALLLIAAPHVDAAPIVQKVAIRTFTATGAAAEPLARSAQRHATMMTSVHAVTLVDEAVADYRIDGSVTRLGERLQLTLVLVALASGDVVARVRAESDEIGVGAAAAKATSSLLAQLEALPPPGPRAPAVVATAPAAPPSCPPGTDFAPGRGCVAKVAACPEGTTLQGERCVAAVDTSCPAGFAFEQGRGCVPRVLACPPGTRAEGGACVALVAACPPGTRLVDGQGCVSSPAALAPAAEIDVAPVTKMRQDGARALVIGIERYRSRELPPATHAEADARVFASYLERTLGVPRSGVKVLLGEHASKGDIEAMLEEWLPANVVPGGTVYLFFSGHGAPDPTTGEGYLVPWDGDPAYLKSKALALSSVYAKLAALPQQRVVTFLDSCFSGAGARSLLPAGARPLVPVKAEAPKGRMAILSATAANETAGPAPAGGHGLFTWHLLRGLSGLADRDGDRAVSLHELQLFVTRAVSEEARLREGRDQTPTLLLSGGGKPGDWIVVDGLVP